MAGLERKYVVFKADEWDKVAVSYPQINNLCPVAVEDAVVLRKQDIFTSSALYEYAGQLRTTIEIIEKGLTIDESPEHLMMRLRKLADQFADEAESAERWDRKVPD